MCPIWLPDPLDLNPVPLSIYEDLNAVFERDFVRGNPRFRGSPVWWNKTVADGYQEGFWHIISRHDRVADSRILDTRRAEKLPWCAPIINNHASAEVTVFDHPEDDGHIRTYLWLEELDYLVLLDKQNRSLNGRRIEIYWLITAYHIDKNYMRDQLRKKRKRSS